MKQFFTQQVKLGASLLESIQSGKLTQLELTSEGAYWLSRAIMAYSLKRWDNMYQQIVDNMNSSPEGAQGKKLAQEWRNLVDNYLAAGNRDYLIGIILWQEMSRQEHEIKALKTSPPPQEMIKPWHIKLLFNPEASAFTTYG
jgi:hypothetical protein